MHDPRCERSGTDPKRCRCQCGGRHHGELASQLDLERKQSKSKLQLFLEDIAGQLDDYLKSEATA